MYVVMIHMYVCNSSCSMMIPSESRWKGEHLEGYFIHLYPCLLLEDGFTDPREVCVPALDVCKLITWVTEMKVKLGRFRALLIPP